MRSIIEKVLSEASFAGRFAAVARELGKAPMGKSREISPEDFGSSTDFFNWVHPVWEEELRTGDKVTVKWENHEYAAEGVIQRETDNSFFIALKINIPLDYEKNPFIEVPKFKRTVGRYGRWNIGYGVFPFGTIHTNDLEKIKANYPEWAVKEAFKRFK